MLRNSLLFWTALVLISCGKKEDPLVIPAPQPPATPVFEPSFTGDQGVQMTIDGDVITLVHGGSLIPFYFADGEQNDPPQTSWRLYSAGIYNGSLSANVFELHIGTLSYSDTFFDPGLFQEYFNPGPREYGITTVPGLSKVTVVHTDPDGMVWSTQQGSTLQTNSTFTIDEKETGNDDQGVWVKIIASFNCTVYNSGGTAKPITNGRLMLEFREYQ